LSAREGVAVTAAIHTVLPKMGRRFDRRALEHDPEKWKPVFRKDHAQTKRLDHDAILRNRIMI
jgi:hypothetical protein